VKDQGPGRAHELVIVGGGISGLALAHFAHRQGLHDVLVVEAAPQAGGKIHTEWRDGWCCEWGPQGFLDNVPETLELVGDLGLTDQMVRARGGAAGDRFIVRNGRLRRLPQSPPAFLLSDALSLPGRLRVLLEPLMPRGPVDESVLQFASRRIGREAGEVLVDAMVTGVYAGDPASLSLAATFPKMHAMEAEHGSLTRAMVARRRSPGAGGPTGPGGTLTTFRLGMQQLVDALAAELGERLLLGRKAATARPSEGGFVVGLADGRELEAHRLAVAVPPGPAAALMAGLLPAAALSALKAIPTIRIAVVMTGFSSPRPFARPTRGFGFLVPGRERRRILGTIFCDSTFPPQAPAGCTLLRTMLGGARDPGILALSDGELLEIVQHEHAELLGGTPEPSFLHVIRHRDAIPQYVLGHLERLETVFRAAGEHPGLLLLGNGYRGIALNSCVAEAKHLAPRLREAPAC
jgi:protoporphyrinogen/coproporphyrinogen III oxidase